MLIAKWLLALGTVVILGGAVVGFVGIYQHPVDGPAAPLTNLILDCSQPPGLGSSPPAGSQPDPPSNSSPTRPGPSDPAPPAVSPSATLYPTTCTVRTQSEVTGGGPVEDATAFTKSIADTERWLAFVAYGVLLIGLGIAFLTSAGVIGILSAVASVRLPGPVSDSGS